MLQIGRYPQMYPQMLWFPKHSGGRGRTQSASKELFLRDFFDESGCGRMTNGAQERTRTSTPFPAPPPEDGASTNSATWAQGQVIAGRPRRLEGGG